VERLDKSRVIPAKPDGTLVLVSRFFLWVEGAMSGRVLIVGYGNPYRRDDGVAYHVINRIRQQQGKTVLSQDEDGMDDLGHPIDTLMQHQLLPELAPLLAEYQTIVFVDAHTAACPDPVRVVPVEPQYGFHAVTHHISPSMLLELTRASQGVTPVSWLVSIRGDDFDFGDFLSPACERAIPEAVTQIMDLIR
jgi:hydrogenase maturation protease